MRIDWLPWSASALVAGGTAFAVAVLMTPILEASSSLARIAEHDQRWLVVAALHFFAGVALVGGMPAVLSLVERAQARLGLAAVVVFTVGALGTSGYAVLLVFVRALVMTDSLQVDTLEQLTADTGVAAFVVVWVGAFYLGLVLIAVALWRSRAVSRWVSVVLVCYLLATPVVSMVPDPLARLDVLFVAVGFAAVGIQANNRHLPLR